MSANEKSVTYLSNASAQLSLDGKSVGLHFTTRTGQQFECALSVPDAQKFLAVVISKLQDAATAHAATPQGASPPPISLTATPIDARAVGAARGRTDGEGLLSVDLGPFQLTFALPVGEIRKLN